MPNPRKTTAHHSQMYTYFYYTSIGDFNHIKVFNKQHSGVTFIILTMVYIYIYIYIYIYRS